MKRIARKLFDIREGEGVLVSLMFFFIFFLIASFLIVKPVRSSLFLVNFGIEKLPYVFLLVALFSAIVASLYSKFSKKTRLNTIIVITLLFSIACLFVVWFFLHSGYQGSWFLYAFYIWVALFGVITGTQFWLLANHVFNAREAKRLFGFIGSGAISGGIFGGYLTNVLAPVLKTENLIFFCIGFLVICIFLLQKIWKIQHQFPHKKRIRRAKIQHSAETSDNPIILIYRSRHLALLAGIIGINVIVANLVDYQFSAVASSFITIEDNLTAFFGFWMSTLNILSLAIQLFLTSRILKYLGVSASLFFMPVGLFFGAVVFLVNPALWSAILIKMSDGSFKHSINKAGTELLALPISPEIKTKVKTFIDVFVKNLAKGMGGILLIVLTVSLKLSIEYISLMIIFLIAVWIYLITKMKVEYVNSFRLAIEKRTIDLDQEPINLEDASVLKSFITVLETKSERQILYVLELLGDSQHKDLLPHLKKLIKNPSDEIKTQILKIAHLYDDLDLTIDAENLIGSSNQTVRIQAIQYLFNRSKEKTSVLKKYLKHEDYRVWSAALICVSREWKDNLNFRKEIDLEKQIENMFQRINNNGGDETQKQFVKINAAIAIGEARDPELYPYLRILAEDESLEVKQAAVQSIGKTRAKEFIPVLISHLNEKHIRKYTRESLAEYGEDIVEVLAKPLENTEEDPIKRQSIPKVLALIDSQKSANLLSSNLNQVDRHLRYEIIKALSKLRSNFPDLRFDKQSIEARLIVEATHFTQLLTMLYRQNKSLNSFLRSTSQNDERIRIKKAWTLLTGAIEEKLNSTLMRTFLLLGLKHPSKDMSNAYQGIKSNESRLRANSVEFLENILDAKFKKVLIPIVETSMESILAETTQEIFGVEIPSEKDCFAAILNGDDNWLKACLFYLLAELNKNEYYDRIVKLKDDPDPLLKETSQFYLNKIEHQ